jgi:5-methylcytosine-specific restriction endonuclease McrA
MALMVSGKHARVYGSAWRKMRVYILARDGHTCQYCAAPATTVDHVEPVAKGGEILNPENLVAACVSCNSKKQDKDSRFFLRPVSTAMLSRVSLSPTNETKSYD